MTLVYRLADRLTLLHDYDPAKAAAQALELSGEHTLPADHRALWLDVAHLLQSRAENGVHP